MNNVSFGAGLIKYGNEYINPDNVVKFKPWVNNKETVISFSNDTELGRINNTSNKILENITAERFADTFIEAQKTGNIIDIEA